MHDENPDDTHDLRWCFALPEATSGGMAAITYHAGRTLVLGSPSSCVRLSELSPSHSVGMISEYLDTDCTCVASIHTPSCYYTTCYDTMSLFAEPLNHATA